MSFASVKGAPLGKVLNYTFPTLVGSGTRNTPQLWTTTLPQGLHLINATVTISTTGNSNAQMWFDVSLLTGATPLSTVTVTNNTTNLDTPNYYNLTGVVYSDGVTAISISLVPKINVVGFTTSYTFGGSAAVAQIL